MRKLKSVLKAPLTVEEIESYYNKTNSYLLTVLVEVTTEDLFGSKTKLNTKISEMIIDSNVFESSIKFSIKSGEKDKKIVLEVTCDVTTFLMKHASNKYRDESDKKFAEDNKAFQEYMIEACKKYPLGYDLSYLVKIEMMESNTDFSNEFFIKKLNSLIKKYEITFGEKRSNDFILFSNKPLWLSFENLSKDLEHDDPLIKPENLKNIVELVGVDVKHDSYYFRVYSESEIYSHEWYDVLGMGDGYFLYEGEYLKKNVLPSIKKGSYNVELITNKYFDIGGYFVSDEISEREVEFSKPITKPNLRGRMFKIKFNTENSEYAIYHSSFINNLKGIVNSGNGDQLELFELDCFFNIWVSLPSSPFNRDDNSGRLNLLGFNKMGEPLFVSEYRSLDRLKRMLTGGINEFNKEYPDRLCSLMPKESFEIEEI